MSDKKTGRYPKITGMLCAPFTPLNKDGSLHTDLVPAYADLLIQNDITGIFVNGSSGEGLLLTEEERMRCLEAWVEAVPAGFKIIAHVGANCALTGYRLAQHAQEVGAWGISAMGPAFPPVSKLEPLADFCRVIAEGAPNLPFYYYHIPALSRIDIAVGDLLKIAERDLPNFAGVKFTSHDLQDFVKSSNYKDGIFDMINGCDELMLASLSMSDCKGFIGGTFNYCARIYKEMLDLFNAGNLECARELQTKSISIVSVINKHGGNMVAGKQVMRLLGLDLGPCRLPNEMLSNEGFQCVVRDLEAVGFYQHANRFRDFPAKRSEG